MYTPSGICSSLVSITIRGIGDLKFDLKLKIVFCFIWTCRKLTNLEIRTLIFQQRPRLDSNKRHQKQYRCTEIFFFIQGATIFYPRGLIWEGGCFGFDLGRGRGGYPDQVTLPLPLLGLVKQGKRGGGARDRYCLAMLKTDCLVKVNSSTQTYRKTPVKPSWPDTIPISFLFSPSCSPHISSNLQG